MTVNTLFQMAKQKQNREKAHFCVGMEKINKNNLFLGVKAFSITFFHFHFHLLFFSFLFRLYFREVLFVRIFVVASNNWTIWSREWAKKPMTMLLLLKLIPKCILYQLLKLSNFHLIHLVHTHNEYFCAISSLYNYQFGGLITTNQVFFFFIWNAISTFEPKKSKTINFIWRLWAWTLHTHNTLYEQIQTPNVEVLTKRVYSCC